MSNYCVMYGVYVRRKLEFASGHSYQKNNLITIENGEKLVTKYIPELNHFRYPQTLAKLNLSTLTYRRTKGGIIQTNSSQHI